MDFLGIGGWEILLILVVALILVGPAKLPQVARTLGKIVRALRKASFDLSSTITREVDEKDRTTPPPSSDGSEKASQSDSERS